MRVERTQIRVCAFDLTSFVGLVRWVQDFRVREDASSMSEYLENIGRLC